jgi:hypothetical protein
MDKKVTELPLATILGSSDILMIIQSSTNKQIPASTIFSKLNVPVHINEAMQDSDTIISGDTDANLLFVDASADRIGIGRATPDEKLDVNGGLRLNGLTRNESIVSQTSSGAIDITALTTVFEISSPATATLGNGKLGQVKELVCNGAGPIVVSGSNTAFTSVTLAGVGTTVTLKYISGKWFIMSNNGATIA